MTEEDATKIIIESNERILNIARRNGFNAICALEFPMQFGIKSYWLIVCESFDGEENDIVILEINTDETINIISNDCYTETQIKNNLLFPYEDSIFEKQISSDENIWFYI